MSKIHLYLVFGLALATASNAAEDSFLPNRPDFPLIPPGDYDIDAAKKEISTIQDRGYGGLDQSPNREKMISEWKRIAKDYLYVREGVTVPYESVVEGLESGKEPLFKVSVSDRDWRFKGNTCVVTYNLDVAATTNTPAKRVFAVETFLRHNGYWIAFAFVGTDVPPPKESAATADSKDKPTKAKP